MSDRKGRILISYARKIDNVRLKHKIRLGNISARWMSALSFVVFVYIVFNFVQIMLL